MKNYSQSTTHDSGLKAYIIGFMASLLLTLGSYFAVTEDIFGMTYMVVGVLVLAVIQLIVQLVFFLHLGRESAPRWNIHMLWLFGMVIVIVVIGSLWIMHHLDYNMMPDMNGNMRGEHESVEMYMKNHEGI